MFSHIVRFFQGGGEMMYPIAVVLVVGSRDRASSAGSI